jgi:sugar/nucleoside kinase (ribokinase family)
MASRVVVIGDVMLDVVVQTRGPIAPTSDTPSNIRVTRGGSGASFAISLRTSGHDTIYLGARGSDTASEIIVSALAKAHVTAHLEVVDAPTGTVVSLVDADGQRRMLTDRGANSLLGQRFVDDQLREPFDHLHVSGYLLLDSATRHVAEHALGLANERGSTTSIDVCSVAPLREVTPDVFLRAAAFASQLFANEEEALVLTGTDDVSSALDVLGEYFDEVVVTLGDQGAVSLLGGERVSVSAHDVEVLDTTGAGDAATGAYLGARLHGLGAAQALAVAMEAASRAVGRFGALG